MPPSDPACETPFHVLDEYSVPGDHPGDTKIISGHVTTTSSKSPAEPPFLLNTAKPPSQGPSRTVAAQAARAAQCHVDTASSSLSTARTTRDATRSPTPKPQGRRPRDCAPAQISIFRIFPQSGGSPDGISAARTTEQILPTTSLFRRNEFRGLPHHCSWWGPPLSSTEHQPRRVDCRGTMKLEAVYPQEQEWPRTQFSRPLLFLVGNPLASD
jgi:hypothetical protein